MEAQRDPTDRPVPPRGLATASIPETLGVLGGVLAPLVAKGIIVRRPRAVALAERLDLDGRAVVRLAALRDRHGTGPLRLRIPGRSAAVLLDPADVIRVLEGTPAPFTAATREKRAALAHFEPTGVLISRGPDRAVRRQLNEAVLQPGVPIHPLAGRVVATVTAEVGELLDGRSGPGTAIGWDAVAPAWWRIVRRVVLGDRARDDHEVTDLLVTLRGDANWAFLHPRRHAARRRLVQLLEDAVATAEPGSLAALVAATPAPPSAAPAGQLPQWLFAFDAAALATVRALALLAAHPAAMDAARLELAGRAPDEPAELPFLRACVLESLRLWPTTPAILRDTTEPTTWGDDTLPAGTSLVIHAPFLHRDERHGAPASRFTPELWRDDEAARTWPLVPFSAGPVACPGRSLVLLVTTAVLAAVLGPGEVRLVPADRLDPARPLPGTLDPFRLQFRVG